MKKFFPAFTVSMLFTIMLVIQMSITGRESGASKINDEKAKYTTYEDVFSNLKIQTTKGTKLNLGKVKQPIVLLNFWASWCLPCIAEFQTLTKFRKMFPENKVLVVGINNDDETPKKAVIKTEKEYNLNFESVIDRGSQITSKFLISKIPASIVFHNGKVIHFTNEEFDFTDENFILKIKKILK